MKTRKWLLQIRFFIVIAIAVAIFSNVCCAQGLLQRVKDQEKGFCDYKATIHVQSVNKENAAKEGYEDLLQLKQADAYFKYPDMFKMSGDIKGIGIDVIQKGDIKSIRSCIFKYNFDLVKDPGKRQTMLDLGFISSSIWDAFKVKELPAKSHITLMLKPKSAKKSDKRFNIIWLDIDTLKLLHMETYNYEGKLLQICNFTSFIKHINKYFADKAEILNSESKPLSEMKITNLKINSGIASSLFCVD